VPSIRWCWSRSLRHAARVTKEATSGVRSVSELMAVVAGGGRPRFVFFWGRRPGRPGIVDRSCFSQWWPAGFTVDGVSFGSAEHYMMWRKAVLFGDEQQAAAILKAGSPAQAKALGRAVSGFDEAVWTGHRWGIVVDGSVAKFADNPPLRDYLLATKNRVLVEASPRDRIWGIGLTADSEFAEQPAKWRGLNLLGFALMEARARLQR
jgi:ribA/ribD-fused uncharacterized protein